MAKRWRRVCTAGFLVVLVTTAQGAWVPPDGTFDVNGVGIAFYKQGSIVPLPNPGDSGRAVLTYVEDNSVYGVTVLTPTPEPATICLLGLGALSLLRRRKNS